MTAIKAALKVVLLVVFVPLILALLFLMPVEFLVSSWHLRQVRAITPGIVSRAEIETNRGGTRSDVEYSYQIGGHDYTSTRLRAGIVSNRGFEAGGGEFSRQHPVGSTVQVHYDPAQPAFAIVEFGWPKWSVGFSLGVWGLVVGSRFRVVDIVRRSQTVSFSLVRAIAVAGFLTIFVMDTTITPSGMLAVVAFYGGAFLVLLCYSNLKVKAIGEPGAAPSGGTATQTGNSTATEGPPSVS